MIHTNVSSDPKRRAAQVITNTLQQHQEEPVVLLLAGGSALSVLDQIDFTVLGKNITATMMDERFSAAPEENNFLQMQATNFHTHAEQQGVTFLPTVPKQNESHEAFAKRMANQLKSIATGKNRPHTIALFGIGPDGHTAAIFPMEATAFEETYGDTKQLVTAVTYEKNPYPQRVSMTPHFIREYLDEGFVYAVGAEKRPILMQLDEKVPLHQLPAHIHSEIGSTLFTDQLYTS